MARKAEEGLQYFPLNTDIVHNPKIKLVVAEFGPKAWAVLLPLFCKIYREKGYWIDWLNEDGKLLFAKDECQCDVLFVDEVVAGCIRRGIFTNAVFNLFGVLTSDRIQENYLEGKKRQKVVHLIRDFVDQNQCVYKLYDNVNIIGLNVNIITKKVNKNAQNRIEEKKNESENNAHTIPLSNFNSPKEPENLFIIEQCLIIAMNDQRWIKANKCTKEDLEKFNEALVKQGVYEKNPADYKRHYANWSKDKSTSNHVEKKMIL